MGCDTPHEVRRVREAHIEADFKGTERGELFLRILSAKTPTLFGGIRKGPFRARKGLLRLFLLVSFLVRGVLSSQVQHFAKIDFKRRKPAETFSWSEVEFEDHSI